MNLQCGDIVKNGWASDDNPTRYFIFIKPSDRYAKVVCMDYDGKLKEFRYYSSDLKKNEYDKFEVVGHVPIVEILIKALEGVGR